MEVAAGSSGSDGVPENAALKREKAALDRQASEARLQEARLAREEATVIYTNISWDLDCVARIIS